MELYTCPIVLFVNLKRFKSSSGTYYKDKLDDKVKFPLEDLDLSRYVLSNLDENGEPKEQILYELYAVSNHFGGTGFGHYTAFAKNHLDGNWYDFDDSSVSKVDPDSVVTEAAYNLFYLRKDYANKDIDYEEIKNKVDEVAFLDFLDQINKKEESEAKLKASQ